MTLFDLFFIASFLLTIGLLIWAAVSAVRGRRTRAARILYRLGVFVGLYFAALIVVSLASPRRVLRVGESQCWDDWCVGVTNVNKASAGTAVRVSVILRVSSRARGRVQGGPTPTVYLLDDRNRRYDPSRSDITPSKITLRPGEGLAISRNFEIPAAAEGAVLALFHGGETGLNFPGCCIIGDNSSLFHEPIVVQLDREH